MNTWGLEIIRARAVAQLTVETISPRAPHHCTEGSVRQGDFDPAEERPEPVARVVVAQGTPTCPVLEAEEGCWALCCRPRGWVSPGLCGAVT